MTLSLLALGTTPRKYVHVRDPPQADRAGRLFRCSRSSKQPRGGRAPPERGGRDDGREGGPFKGETNAERDGNGQRRAQSGGGTARPANVKEKHVCRESIS